MKVDLKTIAETIFQHNATEKFDLRIEKVAHHRNGISGHPFTIVLFDDLNNKSKMIAIIADGAEKHKADIPCFVLDVAKLAEGRIEFMENSWRGDRYFWNLWPLLKEKEATP